MSLDINQVSLYDRGRIVTGGGSGGGAPIVLTGTLEAGETTLTFTNNAIVSTSMCELLPVGGVIIAPTQITDDSTNHSVTFTFNAQSTDISFKLMVINIA